MKFLSHEEIQKIRENVDKNEKFLKSAENLWFRFKNYENNPPVGLEIDNDIKCIAFIAKLKTSSYINLYDIVTIKNGKGYGTQLWKKMIKYYYEQGVERIKFRALYSAIPFYKKLGIYFWGFDGKSFTVDQPLFPTIEETLKWREKFKKMPIVPNQKVLEDKESSKKLKEEIKLIKKDLGDLYYLNREIHKNIDDW
jgi:GNAT superfamily N-acetyltransferase